MKKVINFILLILTLMLTGVFGVDAAASYPFKVANIAYTNSEFVLAEQMKAGDTVYIAATIEKCASSDVKSIVVTAVFDQDNKLYKSYINLYSGMTVGQQLTTSNGISLPENYEQLSVKVMIFSSLSTIMPVALPLEKQLSNAANTDPIPCLLYTSRCV